VQTMLKPTQSTTQKSTTITTNLYELIEAVQDQVGSENDELVVATVMHLLRTGNATFLRSKGVSYCN
jgi:predicted transcriptional regulator